MTSGRLRLFFILVMATVWLNAALVSADIATYHECSKVSDTQLEVTLICEHLDGYYYQYYFSDGTTTARLFNEYSIQHTFNNVSVDSFPLFVYVYVFESAQTPDVADFAAVTIACAELFAPEIDVRKGNASIPSGGTYDAGTLSPGQVQLSFIIDNTNGEGDLTVDDVTAASLLNCEAFDVDTSLPLVVADGESATLRVSITLDDPGDFRFEIDISNNDLDEDSYDIQVEGTVQTAEQAALGGAIQQLIPMGLGGESAFLDQEPMLDEAGDPVMAGILPLSGIYAIGDTIVGAAMVCDPAMRPLRSAWIHAFLYSVNLETRPEGTTLLDHWMIRFEYESECYALEWNTEGMIAGFYDIHLSLGSAGRAETIRIQLVEPEA